MSSEKPPLYDQVVPMQPQYDPTQAPYGQQGGQAPLNGQPGQVPHGQPGEVPYGQPGQVPYGQPGQVPYGQPGQVPYGQPGLVMYGQPGQPGQGQVNYAYASQPQVAYTATGGPAIVIQQQPATVATLQRPGLRRGGITCCDILLIILGFVCVGFGIYLQVATGLGGLYYGYWGGALYISTGIAAHTAKSNTRKLASARIFAVCSVIVALAMAAYLTVVSLVFPIYFVHVGLSFLIAIICIVLASYTCECCDSR
ncbi:uncharacterized protein LOC141911110 [Tubulanus polymorphus]|uniref:uncharacterized protein LOC141911110 n=1 Tax=Tubulanus polymorphus TaxID=672921 RepID=UPI003DA3D101